MPPLEPLDPPEGDVIPYPGDILILGGNRWLDMTGRVIATEFGNPVDVQENTRRYWEGRAAKAGYTLDGLLAETSPVSGSVRRRAQGVITPRTEA